jgi:uncharacterized membrane protein
VSATHVGAATISCGSVKGRNQYCPADTGRGVQLVRQLSRAPCLQSETWGYDRGGVWVTRGCAATFSVGGGGGGGGGGHGHGHGGHVGAAIVGGMVGTMLGAAIAGGGHSQTVTHSYSRRVTTSSAPAGDPSWLNEQKIHKSRMDSIAAGLDPDTDVMAAQLRANAPQPSSPGDAVVRDQMRIDNAIDEDRARIESAGVVHPDRSDDDDQRAAFQANQDFQRQVMIRRANENADSEDSSSSDDAASEESPTP